MRKVRVPSFTVYEDGVRAGWFTFPACRVLLDDDGTVWTMDAATGEPVARIGTVTRGYYTYSPPTHRGSRIVRYHRRVRQWEADTPGWPRKKFRGGGTYGIDTRQGAIAFLIACAAGFPDFRAAAPDFR